MILIVSEKKDFSTSKVIDWLEYFEAKYLLITDEDIVKIKWTDNDTILEVFDKEISFSSLSSYWYRRGDLNFQIKKTGIKEIDLFLSIEKKKLFEILNYKLGKLNSINSRFKSDVNKYIISEVAREVGLLIPDHKIVNDLDSLKKLTNKNIDLATKSISGTGLIPFNQCIGFLYTSIINKEKIKKFGKEFFPSYLQTYIEKKYELRIFYLNDEFYSMAIFSQSDSQTIVDFRNYNREKPNRTIPYNLPLEVRRKISLLMTKTNINCGSIDMIVSPTNEYYFLELNPIGQFGMVSRPCNFNIEKKIAETLIYGSKK